MPFILPTKYIEHIEQESFMNKLLLLKRTILSREAKPATIKKRVKRCRGRKHVLDPLAEDLAETRRVVLQDFLHPLKESREARTTILPAALLLLKLK